MFTGIVEETGVVASVEASDDSRRLQITAGKVLFENLDEHGQLPQGHPFDEEMGHFVATPTHQYVENLVFSRDKWVFVT